ncbi:MAG: DNA starvation/stationary phase protection protein Dps [Candidatus Korobacteraceae bacterium]
MTTATQNRLFRTGVHLPEAKRQQLIELLNARLADASDLKTQTKFAHWNVKGTDFFQLHELFDTIATHLEAHVDLIAERVTALGGVANGTARQAASTSSIPEYDLHATTGEEHVRALTERLGVWAAAVRKSIKSADEAGDIATSDLLTEILREAEKDLWFVEAHIQR